MNLTELLHPPQTIAIVGLSDEPDRPSYQAGKYLLEHGFTIIPVNPNLTEVLGLKVYPSVSEIPRATSIDIVDVFRQPDQVVPIIDDVLRTGQKPLIWLQEGVGSPVAQAYAKGKGLEIVMDKCLMKEHRAFMAHGI